MALFQQRFRDTMRILEGRGPLAPRRGGGTVNPLPGPGTGTGDREGGKYPMLCFGYLRQGELIQVSLVIRLAFFRGRTAARTLLTLVPNKESSPCCACPTPLLSDPDPVNVTVGNRSSMAFEREAVQTGTFYTERR